MGVKGHVQTTWTKEWEGVAEKTTILCDSYLVKDSTGGGGQNFQKFCPRGLYMPLRGNGDLFGGLGCFLKQCIPFFLLKKVFI